MKRRIPMLCTDHSGPRAEAKRPVGKLLQREETEVIYTMMIIVEI